MIWRLPNQITAVLSEPSSIISAIGTGISSPSPATGTFKGWVSIQQWRFNKTNNGIAWCHLISPYGKFDWPIVRGLGYRIHRAGVWYWQVATALNYDTRTSFKKTLRQTPRGTRGTRLRRFDSSGRYVNEEECYNVTTKTDRQVVCCLARRS